MEIICKDKSIGVLIADDRQRYLSDLLVQKGYTVIPRDTTIHEDFLPDEDIWTANVLLLPVPVHKLQQQHQLIACILAHRYSMELCIGGVFPEHLVEVLDEHQIPWLDVMQDSMVASKNAIATAEGTIAECIKQMPINLENAHVIVMGFGKCGKAIAEKLYCMGANVSVVARSEQARSLAQYFGFMDYPMDADIPFDEADAVINTIPAPVLGEKELSQLTPDAIVIDIASAPGGCDFSYCKEKGIHYKHALGLPGIYAPKSSAEILLEAMPFGYKPSTTKWKS